ncbi:MAG: methanethiol S-methyltransferase [Pseudomonadota bacterium]
MKRLLILAFGVASYVVFFATFLYSIGFIGNFLVPKSIDSIPTQPLGTAVAINLALLGLFAVQHSVMARPWFKRWITRFIPVAAERSTYVLLSSLAMIALFIGWAPMGGTVWMIESPTIRFALHALYASGWGLILLSTFSINHFDLFGLSQVVSYALGKPYKAPEFVEPVLYRVVRHPLYVGWFVVFWATPTMTVAHLFFALITTAYTLIAIRWEEKDLEDMHPEYAEYKLKTPMLVPKIKGMFSRKTATASNPAREMIQ